MTSLREFLQRPAVGATAVFEDHAGVVVRLTALRAPCGLAVLVEGRPMPVVRFFAHASHLAAAWGPYTLGSAQPPA